MADEDERLKKMREFGRTLSKEPARPVDVPEGQVEQLVPSDPENADFGQE